jgi:phospholipid transport system substrate-binding protein
MRQYCYALILSVMPLTMAQAQDKEGVCAPAAAFIENTSKQVLDIIKKDKQGNETATQLQQLFAEVVEIDWIGKFVIGGHWKMLSEQQKKQYLLQYRSFLLASYVPLFKQYNGQNFDIESVSELTNDQCIVAMKIHETKPQKSSYSVSYRLKSVGGKYRVHDIVAEGVSLIATQRSEFGAIISQKGFDTLMNRLNAKNVKQSEGAEKSA